MAQPIQAKINLFIENEVSCLSCQGRFVLKYPNSKLYAAAGRDEDQRVTGYTWTRGIQTDILPHHYSVLQCPHCLFADFWEKLEKPGYDPKAKQVYKKLKDLPADQQKILQKFRSLVSGDQPDAPAATALHLAAIFTALLPGNDAGIDHMKLGRLYLRLSWLYQESASPGDSSAGGIGVEKDETGTKQAP